MRIVRFGGKRRAADRDTIIANLTLGDVLQRLAIVAPQDLRALEIIAKHRLRRAWPDEQQPIGESA